MPSTPPSTLDGARASADGAATTSSAPGTGARLEVVLRRALGLTVFVFTAYFFGGASSNQNARLDAIYAFAEPGTPDTWTFRIDRFMVGKDRSLNTLDWAVHDGHYYANKAPGTLWIGALAYKALVVVEPWLGLSFAAPPVVLVNAYLINLVVSVLPLVVAALCLNALALAFGLTPGRALWLSLAVCLGTLWFPYATQLWGHTTAAAFTTMALLGVQRSTPRSALVAGGCVSMAVCTDYLALLSAAAVGVWVICWRPRLLPRLLLGAAAPALALLLYHASCFGGPLVTASQRSNPQFLQQDRALGLFGGVSPAALWSLSFGLRRGLWVQCPVLLLCGVGFYHWIKRSPRQALPYVCLGTSLAYLLVNASFNGWHGGASVGARYLIGALPFLGLALHALPSGGRMLGASGLLLALSTLNMLAIAAVNPLAPDRLRNPLYGYTYRMFFAGNLSPYPFSLRTLDLDPSWRPLQDPAMWNLGQLLGFSGLPSLLPLVAFALAMAFWCARAVRAGT